MYGIRRLWSGWRGVCLVAITYVYFLIFAQFAFLNRLGRLGIADSHLQAVMAAMAVGGIGFSLLATLQCFAHWPRLRVQLALALCGASALCALLPLNLPASVAVAFSIGAGLGMLTVTLVANLRLWIGSGDGILRIGLGTGIGYFVCNIPSLFTASPSAQALAATCLCGVGIIAAWKTAPANDAVTAQTPARSLPFAAVLIAFTALVWLDSAAFFIIQNAPSLKAGTWEGTAHLWANAFLHLAAALLSGLLIRRYGLRAVLALAVLALSIACVLLHQPGQMALASLFYPVGVSFYSVALVAYPSFLADATSRHRQALRAGLIYAIAGWFGSAMGIGMAQHLRQVPIAFVVFAFARVFGATLLPVLRRHAREISAVFAALAVALCLHRALPASGTPALTSAAERGRRVYIAEGCIACHSQYVRPGTPDVLMWGPTETIAELRSQHPPLIGNRRQGPDLSQVGGRRSPLWLKAHLVAPAEVSHASFMPSYATLFQSSSRGDDLVAYLTSLKSPAYANHIALEQAWLPHPAAMADPDAGAHLYGQYCATCHEQTGATRRVWAASFERLPPNLQTGPWLSVSASLLSDKRMLLLARIVKFGIPGTDMPGHEYLSDRDIASISLWLNRGMVSPEQSASIPNQSGETR